MHLFKRKQSGPAYPPEEYEPLIRSSICIGEKTACVRRRSDGKLIELMLLRTASDLEEFARSVGVPASEIKTIY